MINDHTSCLYSQFIHITRLLHSRRLEHILRLYISHTHCSPQPTTHNTHARLLILLRHHGTVVGLPVGGLEV